MSPICLLRSLRASFSLLMRSEFRSTVFRRLSRASTTPRSMTPAPITTPEREGEEDRDQGDDMKAEVDHQPENKSFRVTQRPRANTWMGSATMPTTSIAISAAPTSRKMSMRRTRPS